MSTGSMWGLFDCESTNVERLNSQSEPYDFEDGDVKIFHKYN